MTARVDWHQRPHLYFEQGLWVCMGAQGLKGFGSSPASAWSMLGHEIRNARREAALFCAFAKLRARRGVK
jgi:hypothetical protein